jgi:hypothetical protein
VHPSTDSSIQATCFSAKDCELAGEELACVLHVVAQRDRGVRRFLRQYHIPALIQLGLLAYVGTALPYWSKV